METALMIHSRKVISQKDIFVIGIILLIGLIMMPAKAVDRFIINGDGTITDTKTELMWAKQDNGIPINWNDSVIYCQNYSGGGYQNWRMPTLDELATLYNPGKKNKNGYHIIKYISITASTCWAAESSDHLAGRYNFKYGEVYWLRKWYSGPTRILPVRGGK